ncbi:MAG: TIGR01777 family oxidoreductase [Anaerolineales bacterium]
MKILISGSTGLVGSGLIRHLSKKGHTVHRLLRNPQTMDNGDILWDPGNAGFDYKQLSGFQAIIHLSGENLSNWFWTEKQKARIISSRVDTTKLLARAISRLPDPKPAFLCASAAHYYGDRRAETVNEESSAGEGFLAGVVKAWEDAAGEARSAGARVLHLRFGVILTRRGGFLSKIMPVFYLGLGGKLGSGRQYLPWITLQDVMEIFEFCLQRTDIKGPLNVVAPQEITNRQFTEQLAGLLSRPAFMTIPAAILKFIFRDMGEEMLLGSIRMKPDVLLKHGYTFQYPTLQTALKAVLSEEAD